MVKGLVVGTLSTLNSMMAPFGGIQNPNLHTFPLQVSQQCASNRSSILAMTLETNGERYMTLSVQGQVCEKGGNPEPVLFSVILPQDLLDSAYLAKLPENASYVVAKLPSSKGSNNAQSSGVRIKITKRPLSPEGTTPIHLEWVPNENGQVEHAPMTVWLAASPETEAAAGAPPWARIEFPELDRHYAAPISVSREVGPDLRR
jgi:hypothetical protein